LWLGVYFVLAIEVPLIDIRRKSVLNDDTVYMENLVNHRYKTGI